MKTSRLNKRQRGPSDVDDDELRTGQKKQKPEGFEVVSDIDLWDVANEAKLCHADFKNLFIKLRIEASDVENAEHMTDSRDVKLRAIHVLQFWRKSSGREATRQKLIQALQECGLREAEQILEEKWDILPQGRREAGDAASIQLGDQFLRHVRVELDERPDIITWQKQLKGIYKTRRGGIGFIPGFPKQFASDEFFVELELMKEQKRPMTVKYTKLETYTDLLKLQSTKGISLNHVLVSGLAGTGKTTLISRLAYQWATSNEGTCQYSSTSSQPQSANNLEHFDLVFALDIRKFQVNQDLFDAITKQLLPSVSGPVLRNYISSNADKCLFLFDGYDELGSNDTILNEYLLCGCQTIVTTRPNKVDDFNRCYEGYIQVLLKGFSDKSIEKFVNAFVRVSDQDSKGEQDVHYQSILRALNKNETINNLAHFPLMLAMMCVIWQQNKTLPDTVSSLYHKVIEYLTRHWNAREAPKMSFAQFKSHISFDQLLIILGKTALEGLVDHDSKLIFQEDEFDSPHIVDQGCSLGLNSKDCTVSGFDRVTNVSFIHKTFQEFCAAVYLASLVETDQSSCKSYLSKMNPEDMDFVFKFSCGMNENATKFILSHLIGISCQLKQRLECTGERIGMPGNYISTANSNTPTDPWRLPLILLSEADSQFGFNESMHSLMKPLVSSITVVNTDRFSHDYELVLHKCKCTTPHAWPSFVKNVTIYTQHRSPCLYSVMFAAKAFRNLDALKLQSLNPDHICDCTVFLEMIRDEIVSDSIKVLECDGCQIDITAIKAFLDSHTNLTTLTIPSQEDSDLSKLAVFQQVFQEIDVRSGSITKLSLDLEGPNARQIMPNLYQHANALEYFSMIGKDIPDITPSDLNILFEAMGNAGRKHQQKYPDHDDSSRILQYKGNGLPMKRLDISFTDIGDSSYQLADAMTYLGSLEQMHLNKCNLDEKHFHVLGLAFAHLSKLNELNLADNVIGRSIQDIAQGIGHCKLTELVVRNCSIGSSDVQGMVVSLPRLPQLSKFDLSKNSIGSVGAQALSASLKYIPQLEWLDVSDNNIGSDGAQALSSSLKYTPNLNTLFVSSNNIGSDGAQALSASFQYVPQLLGLHLTNNNIGPDGVRSILKSFKYIRNLESIKLNQNPIGHEVVADIFKHLVHLQMLNSLDLRKLSGNTTNQYPLLLACKRALQKSGMWDDSKGYWFDVFLSSEEISLVKHVVQKSKS
ncbi:NLR family CARD domain-containing protein 4-like [Amphiura filiformis]|uniref:NLR family CARD domain-containing protein 4-like n=1 Tax=Amphiura filiformis TaxID=82378 RepID=UPI003B2278A1